MRASVAKPRNIFAVVLFFVFAASHVMSVSFLVTGTAYLQLQNWIVPVFGVFWASFFGLLIVTFLLRKRSPNLASFGWATLLVGFLLGLLTPTL